MSILSRVAMEPPFRLASYFLIKRFAKSVRTIDRWGAVDRPNYLAGVLAGALQAKREQRSEMSIYEFGVAGGSGLVALQEYAESVERETGVKIKVYGFDSGEGLPETCGDFRDHPDQWRASDYKMDVSKLRKRLTDRTELVLGRISETLPRFLMQERPPVGFISCDVDLYSSTNEVLRFFTLPGRTMLQRVFLYFDDIDFVFNHRFAGEWLSIQEFNDSNANVKIDRWYGVRKDRAFTEHTWFDKMFIAHDLEAINRTVIARPPSLGCQLD